MSDKELIESFLRNSLSEEQQLLFNQRTEDSMFIEELQEATIHYYGRLELKQKLKKIGESIDKKTSPNKYYIYTAAASIVFLFISFLIYFSTITVNEKIFNSYFDVYPNIYTKKGDSLVIVDNDFGKAMRYYNENKFLKANETFEKLSKQKVLNSSEAFYYGISLLANEESEKSKIQLNTVKKSHPLFIDAKWYLSLIYIKQDSVQAAREILNTDLKNNKKAQRLLKVLQ